MDDIQIMVAHVGTHIYNNSRKRISQAGIKRPPTWRESNGQGSASTVSPSGEMLGFGP